MAKNLRPPGQPNQVIVLENAAMRVKIHPRFERDDEMLMPLSDEQNKIAILNVCGVSIPCHIFLPRRGTKKHEGKSFFFVFLCELRG